MISFPNAKINIGLHIISKRPDGYHNIETMMLPIPLCDILEILPSLNRSTAIEISMSGIVPDCSSEENLCFKAYQIMKKHHNIPSVRMHLHKAIPSGAGLGGGSADAAFTLVMLNELFRLQLPEELICDYATELGSDCAFFVANKSAIASGRGEILHAFPCDISGYFLALVIPEIHVSTAMAYRNCKPCQPEADITSLITAPIHDWKKNIVNDFECGIFETFPILSDIKQLLYDSGAVYASMSGSGSSLYGLFTEKPDSEVLNKCGMVSIFKGGKLI